MRQVPANPDAMLSRLIAVNSAVSETVGVVLYKNGAATTFSAGWLATDGTIAGTWTLQLLAGDYVEVFLTAAVGKSVNITTIPSRTYVSAALLFAT